LATKKFDVLSDITERMGGDLILVGGGAVELYTQGWFLTGDLDIITSNKSKLERVLHDMGFQKEDPRHYIRDDIFIDVVGSLPQEVRARDVTIAPSMKRIRIICIEDIIIDRLCACKHWKSERDCEQADYMIHAYHDKLDWEYLRARAIEEEVNDQLPPANDY